MQTATKTFTIRPISTEVVAALRERDDAGRTPQPFTDNEGDSPLRCCNRLSTPGERIVLASYSPLHRWATAQGVDPGPYDETGPVFLHAEVCADGHGDGWPEDYRGLPRVLRAYDAGGNIVGGQVVAEGETDPERMIDGMFADSQVAFIHARALIHGCFTFAIDRASV